jgi:hypothetical protein
MTLTDPPLETSAESSIVPTVTISEPVLGSTSLALPLGTTGTSAPLPCGLPVDVRPTARGYAFSPSSLRVADACKADPLVFSVASVGSVLVEVELDEAQRATAPLWANASCGGASESPWPLDESSNITLTHVESRSTILVPFGRRSGRLAVPDLAPGRYLVTLAVRGEGVSVTPSTSTTLTVLPGGEAVVTFVVRRLTFALYARIVRLSGLPVYAPEDVAVHVSVPGKEEPPARVSPDTSGRLTLRGLQPGAQRQISVVDVHTGVSALPRDVTLTLPPDADMPCVSFVLGVPAAQPQVQVSITFAQRPNDVAYTLALDGLSVRFNDPRTGSLVGRCTPDCMGICTFRLPLPLPPGGSRDVLVSLSSSVPWVHLPGPTLVTKPTGVESVAFEVTAEPAYLEVPTDRRLVLQGAGVDLAVAIVLAVLMVAAPLAWYGLTAL